jgi:uncharacterized membrane protein YphA (DoxX/SURF4 family)
MNLIHKIERWGDGHHPKFLDFIRMALGIFLFFKGLGFLANTANLQNIIENQSDITVPPALLMALVYYVTYVHLVGGILITLGILTRFSSIVQIPVVFGAVFFINIFNSPFNTSMASSIAALLLLVLFLVIGSGKLSLEGYLQRCDQDSISS